MNYALKKLSINSDRLLLRLFTDADAEALFALASDPDVGPRAGWKPHQSVEESRQIIRSVFHNPTTWAIVLRQTGELVGAIGYGPSCECHSRHCPASPPWATGWASPFGTKAFAPKRSA